MKTTHWLRWRVLVGSAALGPFFCMLSTPAHAQRLQIESAIVESASGKAGGISKGEGALDTFFTLQKKVVYDTLQGLGIAFDRLPEDVRAAISRFHTQNFEAFRAFSNGLNALDEGRFAEAKTFFEKAVELDPNFTLATSLQASMPQTNVYGGLQLQAVLREAAKNATTSGATRVDIDASRAVAALLSGQSVVLGTSSSPTAGGLSGVADLGPAFTSNTAGSADEFANRSVVGVAYSVSGVNVALTGEWKANEILASGGQLQSVGAGTSFVAQRGGATLTPVGSAPLPDGTTVSWGTWASSPGASATVSASGSVTTFPNLGAQTHYMLASATPVMPTSGTATFSPVGGFLGSTTGSIGVNFVNRQVTMNNLGFTLQGLSFSALNGQATYGLNSASGFFSGNYSAGSCAGCAAFSPTASAFSGNFAGVSASGLILANILQTGTGTVSGLHAFSR